MADLGKRHSKEYYRKYNQTPKRKKWMREYRIRNRKKIYKQRKEWIERTGKEYYIPKGRLKKKYLGKAGIGRKYEKIALKLLAGSIDCNIYNFKGSHDIEWNDKKIEVKMRNKLKKYSWDFNIGENCDADFYLFFCVNKKKIEKIYFIPADKKSISIPYRNNKYNKYLLNVL